MSILEKFKSLRLSSQLEKLDQFIHGRRKIAKRYDESFSGIDILKIPKTNSSINHAYHLYPLQIDFHKLSFKRSKEHSDRIL